MCIFMGKVAIIPRCHLTLIMLQAVIHSHDTRFDEVMVNRSLSHFLSIASMVAKQNVINKWISDACSNPKANFVLRFNLLTLLKNQAVRLTHYYRFFCPSVLLPLMSSSCALFCLHFAHFESFSLWISLSAVETAPLIGFGCKVSSLQYYFFWFKSQRQRPVSLLFFNQLLRFNFSRLPELDETDAWLCKISFHVHSGIRLCARPFVMHSA